jgi:ornithine decarboxylase
MSPIVRGIADRDWARIIALEAEAYRDKGLSESPDALRSRAGASPDTSFVIESGGEVAGYLLALPYPEFHCPDLTGAEAVVHESANLHLHDLVIAGDRRRAGLGGLLVRHLISAARARAYERISLVSVAGSQDYWAGHGFRPAPRAVLAPGYGPGAAYLSRPLDQET